MIRIKQQYIIQNGDLSRCSCDIIVDGETRTVWFEVDKKYEQYLCTERADAYVIGLLNWCMREGHDIYCDIPVTEELLYNITSILIPSLVKYAKRLYEIKIIAPTAEPIQSGNAVGTGCSCGIDSFYSILTHLNSKTPHHDLSHLCINNVGAFNECYESYGKEKVKRERYAISSLVAEELGFPLLMTDSNFATAFPQNHYLTNTYSSCFAIYMLQKFWRIYYLSSVGIDYSGFSLAENDNHDSANYDLLTLQCFSTSRLRIYSDGGEKTRLEKTKRIQNFKTAQKYLHVCTAKPYNCGVCGKCRRTLVTLDLLDALDDFSAVFDIESYRKNKKDYYGWLYEQHLQGDIMNEPVYQEFCKREEYNCMVADYLKEKRIERIERYIYQVKHKIKQFIPPTILGRMKRLILKK